jgi:hypothetical protein
MPFFQERHFGGRPCKVRFHRLRSRGQPIDRVLQR